MDAAIIEKEALQLSEAERAIIADRLLSSLSPIPEDLKSSWVREADERMTAYRAGEITAVDGPEEMAKLKKRVAK